MHAGQGCLGPPQALAGRAGNGSPSGCSPLGLLFGTHVWVWLHKAWHGYQNSCTKLVLNPEHRIQCFRKEVLRMPRAEQPVIPLVCSHLGVHSHDAVAAAPSCQVLREWEILPLHWPESQRLRETDLRWGWGPTKRWIIDWIIRAFEAGGSCFHCRELCWAKRCVFQNQNIAPCPHWSKWSMLLCVAWMILHSFSAKEYHGHGQWDPTNVLKWVRF